MKEEIAIGIDAGTWNSVIGTFLNHKVEIIPNTIGDSCTPSIVEIMDDDVAVGEETMLHKIDKNNEKNLISEIKRIVGKSYSSLKPEEIEKFNIVSPNSDDKILIKVMRKGKEEFLTPEQILSFIFQKLIKIASDFLGTKITKAVITIPANFDNNQRGGISSAAKMAGIEILRIINEPTAAALAYGLGTSDNLKYSINYSMMLKDKKINRKVVIFDLGGGTFDVTVLHLNDNREYIAVASLGDEHLGGNDFDNKLVDYCIEKFCNFFHIDEKEIRNETTILRRLKNQCEKAKKKLSFVEQTTISIYNLYKDNNLYVEIKRDKFDELCEDLYERINLVLEKVIKDSKFSIQEIDDVVMVGGSSRINKIKKILIEKFGETKIRDNINPDEAVAVGATWQAHKILKGEDNINILDITPFSLGVASKSKNPEYISHGNIMSFLIEKNQKIPCKSEVKMYKTVQDNQDIFKIKLYAGEEKFIKDNKFLKEVVINNIPKGEKGTVKLKIYLEVDKNGIVFINAEVESMDYKLREKYSLYDENSNINNNKTEIIIRNNAKIQGKEKLEEIKRINQLINKKKENLKKCEKDEEKLESLKKLTELLSKLIDIYSYLSQQNDSDSIYQKLFFNYERILNYYSEMILIEKSKDNIQEIINKIKEIFSKLLNDDLESLVKILIKLKEKKITEYCKIIIYCADLLYQEGEKILNEGKKYCRYYSRKFFNKGDKIKSKINEDMIDDCDYDEHIDTLYKELEKKYTNKSQQVDAFTKSLKVMIESKETPYVPSGQGFTQIGDIFKKFMEPENIYLSLDIFGEIADTLEQNKENLTESEAYCRYNIIYIKFTILGNQDLINIGEYENLIRRIDYIFENYTGNSNFKWKENYESLKKEITEKKKEIQNKKISENSKYIEELNQLYDEKMKDNKPNEFLEFIIEKYPFINIGKIIENLKMKELKDKFYAIFGKYHPDNYKGRKDYDIYNEIYMLLVKMEKALFKPE